MAGERDKKRKVIEEGKKVAGMRKSLGNLARNTKQAWCFGWFSTPRACYGIPPGWFFNYSAGVSYSLFRGARKGLPRIVDFVA